MQYLKHSFKYHKQSELTLCNIHLFVQDMIYRTYNLSPLIINLELQFKNHKQSELTLRNIHLFVHDSQQRKELFDNVVILSTFLIPRQIVALLYAQV